MMEEESYEFSVHEELYEGQSGTEKRPESPVSSCVSLKSDRSMPDRPNFKGEYEPQESGTKKSTESSVSSCVSLKSDRSLPDRPNFSDGSSTQESGTEKRPESSVSSCVSLKSDRSMPDRPNFKGESEPQESGTKMSTESSVSSCVSLQRDRSLPDRPNFSDGSSTQERQNSISVSSRGTQTEERLRKTPGPSRSLKVASNKEKLPFCPFCSSDADSRIESGERDSEPKGDGDQSQRNPKGFFDIFTDLERKMIVFIEHEMEMYKKLLRKEKTTYYRNVKQIKRNFKQTVLGLTLSFLNLMNHEHVSASLQNELIVVIQRPLKEEMKNKYHHVCEGIAKQGESASLNSIYTDLYITEGGAGHVNKEHEVRRIEKNQMQQDVQIKCRNMFELLPGQDRPIRTVLTQGVAGIGKSICVQKFILDWAEGKEHQDIQFIFPLPFRELNLKKGNHSLMEIIGYFFPETEGLILTDQNKVMFIFDGLDECKLPLSFHKNEILHNVCKQASLDVVLTNLIKGNLLPSALIWITTRPAAASKIPAECVDRVSEVRGFNDQQKEEYFRKRISDEILVNKIIDHIKQSRSLFIMCHIPVFCWISATVLQRILKETESEETPKTLTNMYTCFLIFQAVQGNVKYSGKNALDIPWDKEAILALGKLAFQHLEENNLIFYAAHLEACGIDPSNISMYSGLCTQETVRFIDTVFSFVHLSIQEFLAAIFAYICVRNEHRNVFESQSTSQESKTTKLIDFLKTAVDKALESDHGHLDLFLRFLLGLSLESNEKLIRGLLTQIGSSSDCRKEIVEYIKLKFEENTSPERSINLFYCLNELNDDSLVKEIQSHMSSGRLPEAKLSPAQWSALVFVLLTSKETLDLFDLKKFIRSDECLNRLLPVVQEAKTALLSECNLTERSCSSLLRVLDLKPSKLTLLDLCYNPIKDNGVELLSEGLKSPNCKLETLSLSFCSITERGYGALASALNPSSPLKELDLRGNDPGDTGVKIITDLLKDTTYKLNDLRLLKSTDAEKIHASLTESLGTDPLLLTELDLSGKIQGDSEMKMLSHLLKDLHCRTKKLKLNNSSITEEGCDALSSALCLNPSHLIELDLNENKLGNSGAMKLCELLNKESCKLQRLGFADCCITEKGYAALASALKSNPSSTLMELDLRGNDPGDEGVQLLTDLTKNENSKLKTLRLLKSAAAEDAYATLTKELGANPLLLREMDLKGKIQGDSGLKQLSDLLKDPHCRTNILGLSNSNITEEGLSALSSAICSNPSHLIELDLSENKLGNSGVKHICDILHVTNPDCGLQKLDLSFCSITEQGYTDLESAVKSNSSLIELVLRGNDPGETGVKMLNDIVEDSQNKLNKLRLLKSSAVEGFCASLTNILGTNPLLLRELDLSGKITGDSAVKQFSDLLEDSHCRTKILRLINSNVAEEDCAALSSALCSNPSHLIELDLSENKLGNSGVKQLCDLVKNQYCKLQKLRLSNCSVSEEGCAVFSSALKSNTSSHLTELDLSGNKLEDKGVKWVCDLMMASYCTLEKLNVSDNNITQEGYAALASALKLNPSSHLVELDLRGNDPGDTGVKLITDLQKEPNYKLKTLRLLKNDAAEKAFNVLIEALGTNPLLLTELDLSGIIFRLLEMKQLSDLLKDSHCRPNKLTLKSCSITEEACTDLSAALCSNPSHLIELDLSGNKMGNCGVKPLCGLLQNPQFKLSKLQLCDCNITDKGSASLCLALKSNPSSHLRELKLSNNKLGDSGVKHLSDLLQNSNCLVKKLNLSFCCISEEGYADLASALKFSSHLEELDLHGNDPGEKGVELLTALKEDPNCSLKILRFLKTPAAEEACASLSADLGVNLLLQTELNLSRNPAGLSGDSRVKQLCFVLQDKHCKLRKLKNNADDLTEESCCALAPILTSSSLVELDLSNNNLQDSGVLKLCTALKDPLCTLETLRLSYCCVREDGFEALVSALSSNASSHLVELDLRGNDPGDRGVELLIDLFVKQYCNQKKLRLLTSDAAEKAYIHFKRILSKDPLLHRELDLSKTEPNKITVKQMAGLLVDPHCRLRKLTMYKAGSIRETDCADLIYALIINPSHLIELNLNENKVDIKGLLKLCDLLKMSHCKLEKLSLSGCCISEEGYAALASALKSNPSSSLRELDLRGNNPGNIGVELITDPDCKLKTIRLLKSSAAEEVCASLTADLGRNPLLLRDLDLSGKLQGDSRIKQLPDLLKDPHCRTKKLKLNDSSISRKEYAALLSALSSNPSHLVELDLSGSKVGNSGVAKISQLLKNSEAKMKKLNLSDCSISEKGYSALASALKSNHTSPLIELDLRGNDPGDKGVKLLTDLKDERTCNLNILRLLKSPAAEELCASLSKTLQTNILLLRKLDLSGKIKGDSEVKQFSDLLKDLHCRTQTVKLNNCSITEKGCEALSDALCSNSSHVIKLDLSGNNLGISGVKHLCALLTSQNSKLQRLGLSYCSVTGEGYDALTSALKSNSSSPLIELDLRGNNPENTGEDLISYFTCVSRRKILRLLKSDDAEEAYICLKHNLQKNPLLPTELNLSEAIPQQIRVKPLSALLEDLHCKLKKLIIYKTGSITERDCDDLISALVKNPSHLIELDLNKNKLDGLGLKKLCDLMKNPHCRLEKLILSSCCISEEGYAALASALESNSSSHLIELDLRDNDPGDTGVKLLTDLQKNPHSKLKKIRLLNNPAAEDIHAFLNEALGTNPLLLTELDLSGKITGDTAVQQLSDLLKDLHCRTKILKLNNSSITERGCAALSAALVSYPSLLIELHLSGNKLGDSGVKEISHLLQNSNSKLELLNLSDCSVSEEGYAALASALESNTSSHLIELDLRGNDPGKTGLASLHYFLQDPNYTLKTLRLLKTAAAEEACTSLSSALGMNLLLQTELNLKRNPAGLSGDSRVKQLCFVLQDKHCKLRKLKINDDDLTEESCSALATVLTPSSLRELDLSNNNLQDSGVKKLCGALKNPLCNLETLSLSSCSVTEEGYAALALALKTNPESHLKKLDLSGNDPGDKGVELITSVFMNLNKTLRLLKSDDAEEACTLLEDILEKKPLLQRELDLSKINPEKISVNQLSALLEDPHCRLQKLTLYKAGIITEKDCADVISALIINPSHMRELNLNENKLDQSALLKLCNLLKNSRCKLEKLRLHYCSIEEKGCADLASALCLNPVHIKVLDLSKNKLGDSGMKQLCELVKNQKCKLQELLLKECSIGEEGCAAVSSALTSNPSHLRELDLQGNNPGKSAKQLSEIMEQSGCNLRLDKSFLKSFFGLFNFWSKEDQKHHSKNQDKTIKKDKDLDGQNNDLSTEEQNVINPAYQRKRMELTRTPVQAQRNRMEHVQLTRTPIRVQRNRMKHVQLTRTPVRVQRNRMERVQLTRTPVRVQRNRMECIRLTRTPVRVQRNRMECVQLTRTPVRVQRKRMESVPLTRRPI
uniref:NACHT domain-containing protein n=1 Tax=Astyanax mexicanus TaxID=7994 RepID=A0A8B9JKF5_ASTMX